MIEIHRKSHKCDPIRADIKNHFTNSILGSKGYKNDSVIVL